MKQTLKTLMGIAAALLFLIPVLFIWTNLAWIKYRPLPQIPARDVRYQIQKVGQLQGVKAEIYAGRQDPIHAGWHFDNAGKAATLSDEQAVAVANRHRANGALNRQGESLSIDYQSQTRELKKGNDVLARCPRGVANYNWKTYALYLWRLNSRREAVGNVYIATALASSGGFSEPHGRYAAALWRGQNNVQVEDLNALIAKESGYYLDFALDINEAGQILCLGRQAQLSQVETRPTNGYDVVLLTPKT